MILRAFSILGEYYYYLTDYYLLTSDSAAWSEFSSIPYCQYEERNFNFQWLKQRRTRSLFYCNSESMVFATVISQAPLEDTVRVFRQTERDYRRYYHFHMRRATTQQLQYKHRLQCSSQSAGGSWSILS
jgi:hypothetical protein